MTSTSWIFEPLVPVPKVVADALVFVHGLRWANIWEESQGGNKQSGKPGRRGSRPDSRPPSHYKWASHVAKSKKNTIAASWLKFRDHRMNIWTFFEIKKMYFWIEIDSKWNFISIKLHEPIRRGEMFGEIPFVVE